MKEYDNDYGDIINNAVDVLAIMSKEVPLIKDTITGMVNNINGKRNVTATSSKYIDLKKYGVALLLRYMDYTVCKDNTFLT